MNSGSYADFSPLLDSAACSKYITGVGFQWAGEDALPTAYQLHPDKKLWGTESECQSGQNSWSDAQLIWEEMVSNYFPYGVGNYMQWNMILDNSTLSYWNWAQNSMVTVDTTHLTVVFTPEFYMTKHFSNAVKPGAHRVNATSSVLTAGDYMAFENSNGQIIVVIQNPTTAAQTVSIQFGTEMISTSLPATSFNTFYIGQSPVSIVNHPLAASNLPTAQNIDIVKRGGELLITAPGGSPLLKVIAPNGRTRTERVLSGAGAGTCRVSVASWPPGVYFVEVTAGVYHTVKRIMISKYNE